MATVSQTFRALIEADSKGAVKDLQKFNGEVDKATVGGAKKTDQLGAAFKKVGGVVAGLGIAKALTDSISAASDLEESVNAVRVTFGDAADAVLRLSEDSARSVGLASSDFNGLAVSFAAFADEVAGPGGDVAGVIDDLTKRSADFASVMNLDVADAARIFSSTLAGESEPIKRFGIVIDDAAVKAKALEMGLADTAAEVSANDKVLARYELLMEATEKTAGDFANTQDSLANQTKIAKAELENAAAALGQELLPIAADAAGALSDVVGVLGDMPEAGRQFAVGAAAIAGGMATIGGRATGIIALLSQVAAEANAIESGLSGDARDYLNRDVSLFEKPIQGIAKFSFSLGAGEWGAWRDEAGAALDAAEAAAARFDGTMLENVTTVDEARSVLRDYTNGLDMSDEAQQHAYNTLIAQYIPGIRESTDATSAAATEAMVSAEMQRDQAKAAEHTATVMKNVADRQQEAAEATERHREAVAALFDEVNDNLSSMFDYEEATIAVEDAVKGFADAAVEALEVANDSEKGAADREQALRDMRTAEIDAANAALDASAKYAESQGAIEGTTEFAMLQRQELDRLADKFPELSDEIGQFIAELDRIPAVKTVSLVINRAGTNAALASSGTGVRTDEFGNLIPGRAAGGPVSAGRTYLVGERGPELLTMGSSSGYVIPNKAIGGGGGSVYNINVTAPAGADADAFGRAVREAIRRETRWSGPVTGWSAA